MMAWKNQWLETFTRRLAWVHQEIPANRLRLGVGALALACAGVAKEYIQLLWALWDTVPRIGVGAIALAGVLNAILVILFIVIFGQIDLKRAIARIYRLCVMNLLLELGGMAVGGMLIVQEGKGSLEAKEFFLLLIINLVATVGMLWYAHSWKRHYEYGSDL